MLNEDYILDYASKIAERQTSIHFHNQGLMDDQVDPVQWSIFSEKVRDAILDACEKFN